jgi:hypothetical protein
MAMEEMEVKLENVNEWKPYKGKLPCACSMAERITEFPHLNKDVLEKVQLNAAYDAMHSLYSEKSCNTGFGFLQNPDGMYATQTFAKGKLMLVAFGGLKLITAEQLASKKMKLEPSDIIKHSKSSVFFSITAPSKTYKKGCLQSPFYWVTKAAQDDKDSANMVLQLVTKDGWEIPVLKNNKYIKIHDIMRTGDATADEEDEPLAKKQKK